VVEGVEVVGEFQGKLAQMEASWVQTPWEDMLEIQLLVELELKSAAPPAVAVLEYTCLIQ
jgi:hypothetical protein